MDILPKRTNAQKTGSKSQDKVSAVFTEFCNIVPVPQDKDLGIDFECELLDGEFPTGKRFGLQCKGTEEVDSSKDFFSIQINKKTLNYWLMQHFPVFLVVVDNTNKIFYWDYPATQIEDLSEVPDNKSIRIDKKFNFNDSIKTIPEDMQIIIEDHSKKYVEYDTISQELKKIAEINKLLEENTNITIGIDKKEFGYIHHFLDAFNNLLDNDFNIIKRVFYKGTWKVGLAYYNFTDTEVTYTIYPISYKMNDAQIKQVDDMLKAKLRPLGFSGHYQENPIMNRPEKYAFEIILSKLSEILENKFLSHQKNLFLINEFMVAFADRFHLQIGIDEKDEYSVSELKEGFYNYMPIWIDEVMKLPHVTVGRMRYIAPDFLVSQLFDDKREEIKKKVRERIEKKQYNKQDFILGDNKFHMRIFVEFLGILDRMDIKTVKRIYVKKDFSRLGGKGGYVWNVHSLDDLEKNLGIFYENLPVAFNDVISENFPKLNDKITFFNGFNKMIIELEGKEKYTEAFSGPRIRYWCVKSDDKKIELFRKGEKQIKERREGNDFFIEIDRQEFKVVRSGGRLLDFIFDDTPMLNYVYTLIQDRFKEYFEKIKEED